MKKNHRQRLSQFEAEVEAEAGVEAVREMTSNQNIQLEAAVALKNLQSPKLQLREAAEEVDPPNCPKSSKNKLQNLSK